jgi:hypothetical protein
MKKEHFLLVELKNEQKPFTQKKVASIQICVGGKVLTRIPDDLLFVMISFKKTDSRVQS